MKRAMAGAGLALAAGAMWWLQAQTEESAQPVPAWEFATVEAFHETWIGNTKTSVANICYHTTRGCRWDTIRVTVDRWGQINDALAAATARLGERGWEPVGLTQISSENRPTVLMKRIRTAGGE